MKLVSQGRKIIKLGKEEVFRIIYEDVKYDEQLLRSIVEEEVQKMFVDKTSSQCR